MSALATRRLCLLNTVGTYVTHSLNSFGRLLISFAHFSTHDTLPACCQKPYRESHSVRNGMLQCSVSRKFDCLIVRLPVRPTEILRLAFWDKQQAVGLHTKYFASLPVCRTLFNRSIPNTPAKESMNMEKKQISIVFEKGRASRAPPWRLCGMASDHLRVPSSL